MWKKFSFVLMVMLVLSLAISGLQAGVVYTRGIDSRTKTWISTFSNGELSSSITSNNRILGWSYTDSSAGTGSIWDSSSLARTLTTTEMISEVSVAAGTVETLMFPLPRDLDNGLVARSTTTTGNVLVFYE